MQGFDFIEKLEEQVDKTNIKPLKLLIIDDEADIHTITKMVLSDFEFEGRPLEFLSTYSKAETIELLKQSVTLVQCLLMLLWKPTMLV